MRCRDTMSDRVGKELSKGKYPMSRGLCNRLHFLSIEASGKVVSYILVNVIKQVSAHS